MKAVSLRRRVILLSLLGMIVLVIVMAVATTALVRRQLDVDLRRHERGNGNGNAFGPDGHGRGDPENADWHPTDFGNRQIIGRLIGTELVVAGIATAAVALSVRVFVRRSLAPLDEMIDVAERIAAGDRTLRVRPDRTDTELGRLASSFDVMVDSLDEQVVRAERSEATMRQFVADASHELRNPAAAIGASAERLIHGHNDQDERERLALDVVRESRRLNRLVGDLLDVARLDGTATDRADLATVNIIDIVTEEARRATDRGADVVVELAEGTNATDTSVVVGVDSITRLISNLLDNATRYSPDDKPVSIDVSRVDEWVLVRITNDGPSIAPEDRERIFDRFTRLDDARSRDTGGSGLGLAISRSIARAHHGELRCVDPPVGRGATFELALPVAVQAADDAGKFPALDK